MKLEAVVDDANVAAAVEAVKAAAATGKIGDGKIFVLAVEQAVRIRTGETGAGRALSRSGKGDVNDED